MVTVVNNTILYTRNLLRVYILSVPTTEKQTKKQITMCEVMNVLINFIMVIISPLYINNHVVFFKKYHIVQSKYIQFLFVGYTLKS